MIPPGSKNFGGRPTPFAGNVGDAVHLRGLIEISNHCVRGCRYCGLHAANDSLVRYRMTADEILACAD